jgi:hypothetical protein
MTTHLGRCRCGAVLHFQPGPFGYKMRCPQCGAGVRLRLDTMATTEYTPAPGEPPLPGKEVVGVVEMEPVADASRPRRTALWVWLAAGGLVLGLALAAGIWWWRN